MKYYLILFATAVLFSCNSNTTTSAGTTADTTATNVVADPGIVESKNITNNKLIIPGKSIGQVAIDDSSEKVFAVLGRADESDAAMGKSLSKWYSKNRYDSVKRETDIFFSRNMGNADERSRVKHIRITSPYFKTTEGIGVTSSFMEIHKQFPDIIKSGSYPAPITKENVFIYDVIHAGIAFEIDEKNNCIGITVHEPGKKAFETYIAFFENIKLY